MFDATLVAGVNLDHHLRVRVLRAPGRVLIGGGALVAAAVVALLHAAGGDVQALGGGQSALLPAVLQAISDERAAIGS